MKLKVVIKMVSLAFLLMAPANAADGPSSKIHIFSGYVDSFTVNGVVPANINQSSITLSVISDCVKVPTPFGIELDFYEPAQVHELNSQFKTFGFFT